MHNVKRINKGMCLVLAAVFLIPHGAGAVTATRTSVNNIVTDPALYDAMAARTDTEAAARASVEKVLGRAEVQRVAVSAGLDLKRAQAAVSVLSGAELQSVAAQAARVDEALAGGSSVVVTSTMVIIGLLILIVILVA